MNQLKKETLADGTINAYGYDGFGNRTCDIVVILLQMVVVHLESRDL
ncbi:hypothetical protein CN639_20535 [Bacillus toyonensis]|nr:MULTISPECIES: RHS repeat domain-containing protein [Bacillus]AXK18663.1 hypothetical protein DPQ31_13585 [Bacillus sp. COPE52]PDY88590.1 hypothetical protein CON67_18270 [Bacillus toyonensis]PEC07094.1 hypothetical protein CON55_30845 [Bacillus toyonensis]PED91888.1 hypothetical protein CON90_24560 [Bacillus toyonensis]PEJ62634.1 hypothetical protein CN906_19695 [Bacillus toyonensis]